MTVKRVISREYEIVISCLCDDSDITILRFVHGNTTSLKFGNGLFHVIVKYTRIYKLLDRVRNVSFRRV